MNHLAHLFLAGPTVESMIGNIAGDFVKGPLHDQFTADIRAGIMEHRRIDSFTDSHPSVAAFRHVMIGEYGHYSRVIADVFFDHFLATDFEKYAREGLDSFLDARYETLDPHVGRMPERLRLVYPRMRDERWLMSYRRVDGIRTALHYMSRRFSRRPDLDHAADMLTTRRDELATHFGAFMPDVIAYAGSLRQAAPASHPE